MRDPVTRREALSRFGAAGLGLALPAALTAETPAARRRRSALGFRQSVARWCFADIPLDDFCREVAAMGLPAIDLLEIDEWPVAHDHGLIVSCGMAGAGTIEDGLSEPANQDGIVRAFESAIPKASSAGVPNVICFFGNRRGLEDGPAIENSIACLERCAPIAEANGVTILVEVLNSKVSHDDYIGDNMPYALEIIRAVASPRVRILYDIYHMQVMEGDIIRTIRDNHPEIAHYHTGGVPGRAEIDESQELFYPAIVRAIRDTGFSGFMAHEFIPRRPDPIRSLREAVELCDL